MTGRDPAVEAAQRARENDAYGPTYEEVAREALAPIRELHKMAHWNTGHVCDECDLLWPCDTARLIYTTEELKS